jgi:hypothetical protein
VAVRGVEIGLSLRVWRRAPQPHYSFWLFSAAGPLTLYLYA